MARRKIVAWYAQATAFDHETRQTAFVSAGSSISAAKAKEYARDAMRKHWPGCEIPRVTSKAIREGE